MRLLEGGCWRAGTLQYILPALGTCLEVLGGVCLSSAGQSAFSAREMLMAVYISPLGTLHMRVLPSYSGFPQLVFESKHTISRAY